MLKDTKIQVIFGSCGFLLLFLPPVSLPAHGKSNRPAFCFFFSRIKALLACSWKKKRAGIFPTRRPCV